MLRMLHSRYLSILETRTPEEFQSELVRFGRLLGFNTITATLVMDRINDEPDFITAGNTPEAFLSTFHDLSIGKICPVAQHCKTSSLPIIWDQSTYVRASRASIWEHQAAFGYRVGVALALHLPQGLHLMMGVDRDQALPACSAELSRLTADFQLFAVHVQEPAMTFLLPTPLADRDLPRPSARELECLRWTMEGKTAWEVGRILGIAEHTVVRHLSNATRKLDCVNKHQAVLKALRRGLIW
jgi:DNA-binding CsgD family transcriptional regulator